MPDRYGDAPDLRTVDQLDAAVFTPAPMPDFATHSARVAATPLNNSRRQKWENRLISASQRARSDLSHHRLSAGAEYPRGRHNREDAKRRYALCGRSLAADDGPDNAPPEPPAPRRTPPAPAADSRGISSLQQNRIASAQSGVPATFMSSSGSLHMPSLCICRPSDQRSLRDNLTRRRRIRRL